jgi:MFS family permease
LTHAPTVSDATIEGDRLARRNAFLLAGAQAISGSLPPAIFATGGLVGLMLSPDNPALATAPLTAYVLGTALFTLPAAGMMRRLGRRPAYMLGATAASLASLMAAGALYVGSFGLFLLSILIIGGMAAFTQSYRFAAADTASEAFRPKAISWVLTGGILAAVIGPQTVIWTKDLTPPFLFAGSYLALGALSLVSVAILSLLGAPPKAETKSAIPPRSTREIVSDRRFLIAVALGVASFSMMNFVMTAGPIAMVACGLTQSNAALAIQWHVLAMFVPSFFTGSLIARFGVRQVIAAGFVLFLASGGVALAGTTLLHFDIALILLGVAWNFSYVGATSMVAALCQPQDRTKVQGLNEFAVFGTVAIASLSSGMVLAFSGWAMVNGVMMAIVAVALLLLGLQSRATVART